MQIFFPEPCKQCKLIAFHFVSCSHLLPRAAACRGAPRSLGSKTAFWAARPCGTLINLREQMRRITGEADLQERDVGAKALTVI